MITVSSRVHQEELFNSAQPQHSAGAPFELLLLGLSLVKGLGRKGLRALYSNFEGDLERVFTEPPETVTKVLSGARVPNAEDIAANIRSEGEQLLTRGIERLEILNRKKIHVLHGSALPKRLEDVSDSPYWLFVEGNPEVLQAQPAIALVGTREATQKGVEATRTAVKMLAPYPITLVSGLAEGIDAAAHEASLEFGVPNIAFLGTGIDVVFPKETEPLRKRIVEQGGAVATEYLLGESYGREKFVERNRLQAGLAHLVIPVEAKQKSGTAHTVRFARAMKRDILGLRWKTNNGILDDIKMHGEPIVDIFTNGAWRELDRIFRNLAERVGKDTYALKLVEDRLLNEVKSRNVRVADLDRLRRTLEEIEKNLT